MPFPLALVPLTEWIALLIVEECARYSIKKIAEATRDGYVKKPSKPVDFNHRDAQDLCALGQELCNRGKDIQARDECYYRALERLKHSRKPRSREIAEVNLRIAEIWLIYDTEKAYDCCEDALKSLNKRPHKQNLPQMARAFNLKCKALTATAPHRAYPFGLLAYGIESFCYAGAQNVLAYERSLKEAWLRASDQHQDSLFADWKAKALDDLKAIKKGRLRYRKSKNHKLH